MSFSASISARLTPTAMAGRASGSATRRNTWPRRVPSVRDTSTRLAAWVRNIARVVM
ncbi:hypothetical protein QFZ27_004239 [Inquilinus ginsengisoli]